MIQKIQELYSECISYIKSLEEKVSILEKELELCESKKEKKKNTEVQNPDSYLERKENILLSNIEYYSK